MRTVEATEAGGTVVLRFGERLRIIPSSTGCPERWSVPHHPPRILRVLNPENPTAPTFDAVAVGRGTVTLIAVQPQVCAAVPRSFTLHVHVLPNRALHTR
ncbi:MAG: hypothetical protein ACRDRL_06055 [Sciscionella sp.]